MTTEDAAPGPEEDPSRDDSRSELQKVADGFWDLRDHAYDHPELWRGIDAERVFQALGRATQAAADSGTPLDGGMLYQSLIDALLHPGGPSV